MKHSTHLRHGHENFQTAAEQLLAELPWWRFRKRRNVKANVARAHAELERKERAEAARQAKRTPKALRGISGAGRKKR